MYRTLLDFHKKLEADKVPIMYCLIETNMGWRAYGFKELKGTFDPESAVADGTYNSNSSVFAGSTAIGAIDRAGKVLSFGSFERTISPRTKDVINSMEYRQLQHTQVTLSNHDQYFTKLIPTEPFLTKPLKVFFGFEGDSFTEHLSVFRGVISEIRVEGDNIVLEADER